MMLFCQVLPIKAKGGQHSVLHKTSREHQGRRNFNPFSGFYVDLGNGSRSMVRWQSFCLIHITCRIWLDAISVGGQANSGIHFGTEVPLILIHMLRCNPTRLRGRHDHFHLTRGKPLRTIILYSITTEQLFSLGNVPSCKETDGIS